MFDKDRWKLSDSGQSFALFPLIQSIGISSGDIQSLKEISLKTGRNGRICLHYNESDPVHHMIILERSGRYYPPHRHESDSECFIVMEGQLGVLIFSDNGEIESHSLLIPGSVYRAPLSKYHAVHPVSDFVLYYESKSGPYSPLNALLPAWAPNTEDEKGAFRERISRRIVNYVES